MYNYLNPFVIVMTIGIFIFFQNGFVSTNKSLDRVISAIAQMMLGVYVIHPLWIELLDNFNLKLTVFPIITIPIYSGLVFLFSLASCILRSSAGSTWELFKS